MRWWSPLLLPVSVILSGCEGMQSTDKARQARSCPDVVYARAEQLGVDRADIEKLVFSRIRGGSSSGDDGDYPLLGFNAWLNLQSCDRGNMVIELTTSCAIRQVYTRGGCRVPGIRHF